MGLRAYVYKSKIIGPCANGGISDKYNEVVIVNANGPFDPTDDAPAVVISKNALGDPIIVPASKDGKGLVGPMAGGSFVSTSDSRFSEAIYRITGKKFYGAVSFHDRFETVEQYDSFSR